MLLHRFEAGLVVLIICSHIEQNKGERREEKESIRVYEHVGMRDNLERGSGVANWEWSNQQDSNGTFGEVKYSRKAESQ